VKTVLVVDDDDPIRRMLTRLLGIVEIELSVYEADDGASALEQLKQRTFDLILLDQMMPDKSGVEILRELRADGLNKATTVIMLTARTDSEQIMACLEAGANFYLAKPFEPQELLDQVSECLGCEKI
jgi:DNA-binding response OmpR family regulator